MLLVLFRLQLTASPFMVSEVCHDTVTADMHEPLWNRTDAVPAGKPLAWRTLFSLVDSLL